MRWKRKVGDILGTDRKSANSLQNIALFFTISDNSYSVKLKCAGVSNYSSVNFLGKFRNFFSNYAILGQNRCCVKGEVW
jgi:hypothetical protein